MQVNDKVGLAHMKACSGSRDTAQLFLVSAVDQQYFKDHLK
jgi:hypothetical protein